MSKPHEPPQDENQPRIRSPEVKAAQPFSLQAAKFSFYAPFVLVLINLFLLSGALNQADDAGENRDELTAGPIIGAIAFLTTVAAFVFGVIGLVGGIQRRAAGTIILAVLGTLLNGLIIYGVISLVAQMSQRAA